MNAGDANSREEFGIGDDDEAWRSIVDNYGERAELADDDPAPMAAPVARPADVEEHFVPPVPPLPHVQPHRLVAWLGVLGSPAVLVACLLLGLTPPSIVNAFLVVCFLAAFASLVATMPKGPRDPFDDGAEV